MDTALDRLPQVFGRVKLEDGALRDKRHRDAPGCYLAAALSNATTTFASMDVAQILQAGCEILDSALLPHGFVRSPPESGPSHGGPFACTWYVRGNRRLEVHFRWSLGLVSYHLGAASLPHERYMLAKLGRGGGNQYPGFSTDPLDGFRHLRHDLEHHCSEFLSGSDEAFLRVIESAPSPRTGFKGLSR